MAPTWLRIDSVCQTISGDTVLCEVSLSDDTRAESIDLRVDDEKLWLRCRDDSAAPVSIAWSTAVQGGKAAARLIRRKRMLAVRAPLDSSVDRAGRRKIRATVRALGRGSLVLRVPLALASAAANERAYVLASRRGSYPSLEARDYGWCATFSKEEACDPTAQVEVTLSCAAWGWDSSEVYLLVGRLPASAQPPAIAAGCEQTGCEFKVLKVPPPPKPPPPKPAAPPAALPANTGGGPSPGSAGAGSSSSNGGAAGSASAGLPAPPAEPVQMIAILVKAPRDLQKGEALTFEHAGRRFTTRLPQFAKAGQTIRTSVPRPPKPPDPDLTVTSRLVAERLQLDSPAMVRACKRYDAAFCGVEGAALAAQYIKSRPPKPTWSALAGTASGGVEDISYTSLTYGEAEFVPLLRLLLAVGGVAAGSEFVDLGSGTGRVALGVALAFPAAGAVKGVEVATQLHEASINAHALLQEYIQANASAEWSLGFETCAVNGTNSSGTAGSEAASSGSASSGSAGSGSTGLDTDGTLRARGVDATKAEHDATGGAGAAALNGTAGLTHPTRGDANTAATACGAAVGEGIGTREGAAALSGIGTQGGVAALFNAPMHRVDSTDRAPCTASRGGEDQTRALRVGVVNGPVSGSRNGVGMEHGAVNGHRDGVGMLNGHRDETGMPGGFRDGVAGATVGVCGRPPATACIDDPMDGSATGASERLPLPVNGTAGSAGSNGMGHREGVTGGVPGASGSHQAMDPADDPMNGPAGKGPLNEVSPSSVCGRYQANELADDPLDGSAGHCGGDASGKLSMPKNGVGGECGDLLPVSNGMANGGGHPICNVAAKAGTHHMSNGMPNGVKHSILNGNGNGEQHSSLNDTANGKSNPVLNGMVHGNGETHSVPNGSTNGRAAGSVAGCEGGRVGEGLATGGTPADSCGNGRCCVSQGGRCSDTDGEGGPTVPCEGARACTCQANGADAQSGSDSPSDTPCPGDAPCCACESAANGGGGSVSRRLAPVELLCADFLTVTDWWCNADLVFATSLFFPPELVAELETHARRLRKGIRLVCMQERFGIGTFRPLPVAQPQPPPAPQHRVTVDMSFGLADFFLFERM